MYTKSKSKNERIVFDNGGGITLQLNGYAHWYNDEYQCAEDILCYQLNKNTEGWEGHEEESMFEPTQEEINNGGFRVVSLDEFLDPNNHDEYADNSWYNISELYTVLSGMILVKGK